MSMWRLLPLFVLASCTSFDERAHYECLHYGDQYDQCRAHYAQQQAAHQAIMSQRMIMLGTAIAAPPQQPVVMVPTPLPPQPVRCTSMPVGNTVQTVCR
jgi:hypothetical protein